MKCYRTGFENVKSAVLGLVLAIGTTATATTIEVDADGGATLVIDNIATNAQNLAVGTDNSGNSLTITNSGIVTVENASVGSKDMGDNKVLVAGSNSFLQAQSALNIGTASGSEGNQLTVSDSGWIFVGDHNSDLPPGSGIYVGSTNEAATLSIGSGSQVEADNLLIGTQSNATGSVSLTGADATFSLSDDLLLGTVSSSNSLNVANGASLTIGNDLMIGSTNNTGNQLTIGNGGSVVVAGITTINSPSNNVINVNSGGHLGLSQGLDLDDDTDGINIATGASLELGGTVLANTMDHHLDVSLTGAGTTWSSTTNHLIIGENTDGNSLTLKDGASLTNATGGKLYIGKASDSNKLVISGADSSLLVAQNKETFVGAEGSENTFTVESNAVAHLTGALKVGNTKDATGNTININSGAHLIADTSIIVGFKGGSNTFNMDGGQVNVSGTFTLGSESNNNKYYQTNGTNDVNGSFVLGGTTNADGITYAYADTANRATIGTNSTMIIHQNLIVGKEGNGNTFSIRDGGVVNLDGDAIIGQSSDDNYIFLMEEGGTNNLLNVASNLVIGVNGGDNRFSIYGGIANIAGNLDLGASTNQYDSKNYIHLETTNAVLNVANAIELGAGNSGNTFDVRMGAQAHMQDLLVGTHEGVSSNVVTVAGRNNYGDYAEGSLVSVSNSLIIGSDTGTGNAINVEKGGTLYVSAQNKIEILGSNNVIQIAEGGTLKTGDWDFSLMTGSATNILLDSGSTLHLLGELSGTNMLEGGLTLLLDGTNSSWNTGTNSLYIGATSSDNSLTLTNGASASTLSNLYIGTVEENDDAWPNALNVMGGSFLDVGGDAYVGYANTVKIDSTSQMHVNGNYEQGKFTILELGISSNQVQPNLVVEQNAEFTGTPNTDEYPIFRIFNEGVGESNIITIVQAGGITIDGETATVASIKANIASNLLFGFSVTVSNDLDYSYIVLDDFIMRSLGETLGLTGQLLSVANEIESLTSSNATSMLNILDGMDPSTAYKAIDNYYGEKMSSSPAHNAINIGVQSVSEQLTKRADSTRARMGMASVSEPDGAGGPHTEGQPFQGWITGYKTWADKSADSGFDGYDGSIGGFLVGSDMSVAEGILVGIAGGAGSSTLDKDNGASTDTDTAFGSIYMSVGTKDWFADASLIYGGSSVDISLGSTFDTKASYDAQNTAVYFGGGKEITGNYLIITPHASLLANYYKQDGYEEKSSNAVGRQVDSFDTLYLQSELGCNLGFYAALGSLTLKPELRASWMHEFNAQDENLTYNLIGGTNPYVMTLQAPEEDIIKLGAGVSAKIGEYLELRADLDTRRGSNYSDHTLLGSLRYQF